MRPGERCLNCLLSPGEKRKHTLAYPHPLPSPSLPRTTTSATRPGWYWWKRDPQSREIVVEVRLIDGQLIIHLYFRDDVPVADAKGYWRGPLRPSTGPGSPTDPYCRNVRITSISIQPYCGVVRISPRMRPYPRGRFPATRYPAASAALLNATRL